MGGIAAIGRLAPLLRWLAVVLVLLTGTNALADGAASAGPDAPPQVKALLQLLSDPAVQHWLDQQRAAEVKPPAAPPEATAPEATASSLLDQRLATFKTHFAGLAAAVPELPDSFARAGSTLYAEMQQNRQFRPLLLILGFIALGFGAERLFWWATGRARRRISEMQLDTVGQRLRAVVLRFAFGVGLLACFALGSVGSFVAFDWPPLLRAIVLGYIVAFLGLRIALIVARFLLAPPNNKAFANVERFRIIPMSNEAARYWFRRVGWLAGWFAFGYTTIGVLASLGFQPDARRLVAYTLGLGLLAMGFEMNIP